MRGFLVLARLAVGVRDRLAAIWGSATEYETDA
jgi:hypothetical protein